MALPIGPGSTRRAAAALPGCYHVIMLSRYHVIMLSCHPGTTAARF